MFGFISLIGWFILLIFIFYLFLKIKSLLKLNIFSETNYFTKPDKKKGKQIIRKNIICLTLSVNKASFDLASLSRR